MISWMMIAGHQQEPYWLFKSEISLCPIQVDSIDLQHLYIEIWYNKTNMRDLIAATSLVTLLKLDSSCWIFSLCGDFLFRVSPKFDEWPWKTIGHIFYAASSSVHHFIANREFKLESQSGNAQLWSKSAIFLSRVILKFDGWPWKTIGHLS